MKLYELRTYIYYMNLEHIVVAHPSGSKQRDSFGRHLPTASHQSKLCAKFWLWIWHYGLNLRWPVPILVILHKPSHPTRTSLKATKKGGFVTGSDTKKRSFFFWSSSLGFPDRREQSPQVLEIQDRDLRASRSSWCVFKDHGDNIIIYI